MQEATKADIQVHANCGCGQQFRPDESEAQRPRVQLNQILEAAIRHAETTGHTMDILGTIRVTKTQTVVIPAKWKGRANGKE